MPISAAPVESEMIPGAAFSFPAFSQSHVSGRLRDEVGARRRRGLWWSATTTHRLATDRNRRLADIADSEQVALGKPRFP